MTKCFNGQRVFDKVIFDHVFDKVIFNHAFDKVITFLETFDVVTP